MGERKKPLHELIQLSSHTVISNVYQRRGVGGRPALVINHDKCHISTPIENHLSLTCGVEATSAMIVPKNLNKESIVKRIILFSIH